MARFVAVLFASLLAVAAVAAPAPFSKSSGPWFDGWDKPVGPAGTCKFERNGDQLTITVPGKGHGLHDDMRAPRLLRPVEGDFDVQVRVGGTCYVDAAGYRAAGICVTDGRCFVTVTRTELRGGKQAAHQVQFRFLNEKGGEAAKMLSRLAPNRPYGPVRRLSILSRLTPTGGLRLVRRGDRFEAELSEDGKGWTKLDQYMEIHLGRALKVGVIAGSMTEGTFKVTFDQFKLTNLSKQGRRANP